MAVLPASKAYPRGGAPRRVYTPGAPLYAKMAMKLGGVEYKRGDLLDISVMSKHKHWELWTCGKADHLKHGPFDRPKAAPVVELTPEAGPADETATADEPATAPGSSHTFVAGPDADKAFTVRVGNGETIDVRTDAQRKRRR